MIEQVEVHSAAMDELIELPWRVYADDPGWIPPLRGSVRETLGPENPFFAHGEAVYFAARTDGEIVGRCAAIFDSRMKSERGQVGMVGYFEAFDDRSVAHALFDAAIAWLKERGAAEVLGPLNFSIINGYRLKVDGFDRPPHLGEPHNPQYYPALFESYGFEPAEKHVSWDLTAEHLQKMLAAASAEAGKLAEQGHYSFRSLDLDRWDDEIEFAYDLVEEGFSTHRGFGPVSLEEYRFWNKGARMLIDPDLVTILVAEDGSDAGLGYVFPDYAELMRALDGELDLEALPELVKSHPAKQVLLHTAVGTPKIRNQRAIVAGLARALGRVIDKGYAGAIGAFVRKDKPAFYLHFGPATREYHLYALDLR